MVTTVLHLFEQLYWGQQGCVSSFASKGVMSVQKALWELSYTTSTPFPPPQHNTGMGGIKLGW